MTGGTSALPTATRGSRLRWPRTPRPKRRGAVTAPAASSTAPKTRSAPECRPPAYARNRVPSQHRLLRKGIRGTSPDGSVDESASLEASMRSAQPSTVQCQARKTRSQGRLRCARRAIASRIKSVGRQRSAPSGPAMRRGEQREQIHHAARAGGSREGKLGCPLFAAKRGTPTIQLREKGGRTAPGVHRVKPEHVPCRLPWGAGGAPTRRTAAARPDRARLRHYLHRPQNASTKLRRR